MKAILQFYTISQCGGSVLADRRWDSATPVKSWIVSYDSPPASATNVTSSSFQDMLRAGGCQDATECFLTVVAFNGSAATGRVVSQVCHNPIIRSFVFGTHKLLTRLHAVQNYLLLAPFYDVVTMRPPRLNVSSVRPVTRYDARVYENAFAVTVTAEAPAAFVWLETQYDSTQ